MKKEKFSILSKILIVVLIIIAFIIHFSNSNYIIQTISHYTTLSNLFCLILMIIVLIKILFKFKRNIDLYVIVKGIAIITIVSTGLIYNIILRNTANSVIITSPLVYVSDFLLHILIPILIVLDYLLFDEKGKYNLNHIKYFILFPFIYYIYILIYGLLGGTFINKKGLISKVPYYFLDINNNSLTNIVIYILGLIIFIFTISCLFIKLDNILAKKKEKI